MTRRGAVRHRASARRRPRFVIMVWGLVPGGTLTVLRHWVPRLAERGEVTVVSLGPNRASLGVPTVLLGSRWSHPFRFPNAIGYVVRMAAAAIRGGRAGAGTVLLPQDALATGAAAVLASLMTGSRVAVMEHGSAAAVRTDTFWRERSTGGALRAFRQFVLRAMLGVLHRIVLRRMDLALLAGDEELAAYRSRGVEEGRLLRYRFGVDIDLFHPPSAAERTAARQRWGASEASGVILSIGRLAPEKGLDDLLAAVATLPDAPAPQLLVAGDGPLRFELEHAAATAGVHVKFVGDLEREDVASILHAADCFVYTARRGANTPFAVLEAMSSGLPVVATAAPTVHRRMLADGRGIAIDPGDRGALHAGIMRFLGDRAASAASGAAARRYVVAHHAPAEVDRAVSTFVTQLWPAR